MKLHRWMTPIRKEEGSAIVIALLVLMLLTFMGVTAMQQTRVEMAITRNSAEYRRNFYQAESAAIEVAQVMENEPNPKTQLNPNLTGAYVNFLKDDSTDMTDPNNWVLNTNSAAAANLPLNSTYAVQALGIIGGSSLAMGATNLYSFSIYGMYQQVSGLDRGISLIEMGYRKRY